MKAFTEFAYIKDNKIINIGCYSVLDAGYTLANFIAKEQHGDDAYAVEVTQYPVQIGDDYIENKFYRDDVEILPFPTDEQEIQQLNNAIDDLIIAITPTEEN